MHIPHPKASPFSLSLSLVGLAIARELATETARTETGHTLFVAGATLPRQVIASVALLPRERAGDSRAAINRPVQTSNINAAGKKMCHLALDARAGSYGGWATGPGVDGAAGKAVTGATRG
jgi:hypothetical protein